jgi:hypothetical protein
MRLSAVSELTRTVDLLGAMYEGWLMRSSEKSLICSGFAAMD